VNDMTDDRRAVLVTRPEAEAADTAGRVERRGFRAVLAPALRIESRTLHLPAGMRPQAVLLTSGNALPSLPASLHDTKLLAVGDASAGRARACGFRDVSSAGRDAAALADVLGEHCAPDRGTLLLPVGVGHGVELAENLRARGFAVLRRVAYAARPVATLPESAMAALAGRFRRSRRSPFRRPRPKRSPPCRGAASVLHQGRIRTR
jgi:uroporphyrinogen-III synthase